MTRSPSKAPSFKPTRFNPTKSPSHIPTKSSNAVPSKSPLRPTTSPIVVDGITDIEYLGCWNDCTTPSDDENDSYYYYGVVTGDTSFYRTLPYLLNNSASVMTIDLCWQYASEQGFPYFAVQSGGQCFAGTNLTMATSQGQSDACNFPCGGNAKEICGGSVGSIFLPQLTQK